MYTLPIWALKPHLSHTSCGKGRADGAAGGEMGGKKGKSSKRGGAKAFNIIAISA